MLPKMLELHLGIWLRDNMSHDRKIGLRRDKEDIMGGR